MLAEQVRAGTLPPVEQRLPAKPVVSKAPEIGAYSNVLAHNIFEGIDHPMNMYIIGQQNRTQFAFFQSLAIWSLDEEPVLEPDLAESWEFSDDGKEITFHLREGVRWSDGVPFTVDDILFTYYDIVLNDDMVNPQSSSVRRLLAPGGDVEMEKIDDYTFKIVMTQPYPRLIEDLFAPGVTAGFHILPKHEMKAVHPKYSPEATLADWQGTRMPKPKQRPAVIAPWITVGILGDKLVCERNPYYWKVDRKGQQLPYFDRFLFKLSTSGSEVALGLISGEIAADIGGACMMEAGLVKQYEKRANLKMVIFPEVHRIHGLWLNFDHSDESLRWLFTNPKFQEALSLTMDRDQMAERTGPVMVADRSSLPDTLRERFPELDVKYELKEDRPLGLKLLEEIGVVDTDGDSWREFPSGVPKAGQPVSFTIVVAVHDISRVRSGEDLVEQLRDMGFDARLDALNEQLMNDTITGPGNFDMYIKSPGFGHGIMYCLDRDRLPVSVLPVMLHELPSFQRKTGATHPLPWQVEWLRLVDEYEAGMIEEETALRQIAHLIGRDGWRGTIPMGGVRAFTVFRKDIGNNPRVYHPHLSQHKGQHIFYSWNGFVHGRIWEWYKMK
jgi:peptide/nickel transport system substrate-binding protein